MERVYIEFRLESGFVVSGYVDPDQIDGLFRRQSDLATPYEGSLVRPPEPLVALVPAGKVVAWSTVRTPVAQLFHRESTAD